MIISDQFFDVLSTYTITELQKVCLFNKISPSAILSKSKPVFTQNQIRVLVWSEKSLDLDPIEDCGILQKNISKMDCTTKSNMITAINRVWFHDKQSKGSHENLVKSIPTRVKVL